MWSGNPDSGQLDLRKPELLRIRDLEVWMFCQLDFWKSGASEANSCETALLKQALLNQALLKQALLSEVGSSEGRVPSEVGLLFEIGPSE